MEVELTNKTTIKITCTSLDGVTIEIETSNDFTINNLLDHIVEKTNIKKCKIRLLRGEKIYTYCNLNEKV